MLYGMQTPNEMAAEIYRQASNLDLSNSDSGEAPDAKEHSGQWQDCCLSGGVQLWSCAGVLSA